MRGAVAAASSEGIVSKHWDRGYRAGRSTHWIKVQNPD
jgi:ATP-dependent DNA ligase